MTTETIGIVVTNAVIFIGAVWRVSWLLSKIETQLAHVIKDHDDDNAAVNTRLNAHEARILSLERTSK